MENNTYEKVFLGAKTYIDEAAKHSDALKLNEAESSYLKALQLYGSLPQENARVLENTAATLNALAGIYKDNKKLREAQEGYEEALGLFRQLVEIDSKTYTVDLAATLNNLAYFYTKTLQAKKADTVYNEAVSLYEKLAQKNPELYGLYYAQMLVEGVMHHDQPVDNLQSAKEYLEANTLKFKTDNLLGLIKVLQLNA